MAQQAAVKQRGRIDKAIEVAEKLTRKEDKEGFAKWASKAMERGAGLAHMWIRDESNAPPLPKRCGIRGNGFTTL